jgi:hypothetical protein
MTLTDMASVEAQAPTQEPLGFDAGARIVVAPVVRKGETATERLNRILPWTTKATDRFVDGVYRVPIADAKRMREIQLDPEGWLTALKFDVDGPDAATRWIDAGLPRPNFITIRPENGHAHYVYMLAAWVEVDPTKRATQYLAAVERGMAAALGADMRYTGALVHNPLCSDAWNVHVGRDEPYLLDELAQHVDMHIPIRRTRYNSADSGVGRNVNLFERLRLWAYRAAARGRAGGFAAWHDAVAERCAQFNHFPDHPKGNLPASEVRSIAKSVARWVWAKYAPREPDAETIARRRERERERQARREAARNRSTMTREQFTARAAKRRSQAARWRAEGVPVKQIAERLSCCVREVYRLLATVTESVACTTVNVVRSVVKRVADHQPTSLWSVTLSTTGVVTGSPGRSGYCVGVRPPGAPGLAYVLQRCRELAGVVDKSPPTNVLEYARGRLALE